MKTGITGACIAKLFFPIFANLKKINYLEKVKLT